MPSHGRLFCLVPATLAAVVLAAGCSSIENRSDNRVTVFEQALGDPEAVANVALVGAPGSRVGGRARFSQHGAIVVVRVDITGLEPNREYGLHVHEHGDCLGATAAGIGGHFNPEGKAHGRPGGDPSHAGDLPNVRSDGEGTVLYSHQSRAISITGGARSVIGRSVVVSRNPDDFRTQPDGNSGPPLACGFIRRS